jgi:hypothetical protein
VQTQTATLAPWGVTRPLTFLRRHAQQKADRQACPQTDPKARCQHHVPVTLPLYRSVRNVMRSCREPKPGLSRVAASSEQQ